jgi:hypothetical protein
MKPGGSLPYSQEPTTCPCNEPNECYAHLSCFFKMRFNIIVSFMSWSFMWSLLATFPHLILDTAVLLQILDVLFFLHSFELKIRMRLKFQVPVPTQPQWCDQPPDSGQLLKWTVPYISRSNVIYVIPVTANCTIVPLMMGTAGTRNM